MFDTFLRELGDGMERRFLAWQGGVALGRYRGLGLWSLSKLAWVAWCEPCEPSSPTL